MKRLVAASILSVTLAGCRVGPGYPPSPPAVPTYEDAWMQGIAAEREYARGFETIGYNPAIMTIPNRPFTAKRTYKAWPEGGSEEAPTSKTIVTIARDSRGRIHYESSDERGEIDVLLSDPVDHIQYRYWISRRHPRTDAEACATDRSSDLTFPPGMPPQLDPSARLQNVSYSQSPSSAPVRIPKDIKVDLGQQDFQGVMAVGQRTLHTVVNRFGTRVMTIEQWFSPDLGLNLLKVQQIPGQESTSVRTREYVFAEPDPALFDVPPAYTLPPKLIGCHQSAAGKS
jgi:hypothetical protein